MDGTTAQNIEDGDYAHRSKPGLFVHEFVAGGGFAGVPLPEELLRQGAGMLNALLADLAASGARRLVTTRDERVQLELPPGVVARPVAARRYTSTFRTLARAADEVWIIAPESDDRLAALSEIAESLGTRLIGSSAAAVRLASDKLALARRLTKWRIPGPRTWAASEAVTALREAGLPLVVKPRRGAGCEGVSLARDHAELDRALTRLPESARELVLQEYIPGCAASVSLLCAGRRARPLSLNAQEIRPGVPFSYAGGSLPLTHAAAEEALDTCRRLCERIAGLAGYVGVDLVLSNGRPRVHVIEVNPRLTTSYIGLRAAIDVNLAEQVIRAVTLGQLTGRAHLRRRVRFSAAGASTCELAAFER